ncbi:carboxylesterase/lipase family protein [Massilia putida]|uniref:carboxylesterase/lipase family protein n=1 Tax=Massilia putida TaxID=1141883 RepID=UPI0009FB1DBE|nr:carboxylesterase family protein [Massilia putida]
MAVEQVAARAPARIRPSATAAEGIRATEVLQVEGGALEGRLSADEACRVYKGIPYAAPPVGALRWRPPQPVLPWHGVLQADRYGAACVQSAIADDSIMRQFSFAEPPECALSEDCLYLNVWAPAGKALADLPVIVWVYGGGHRFGSGSHPVSDGERLARKGSIVVSVNYRVGALGYLAHPALSAEGGGSGNYASMDVLAALRWVRKNIAAFGGDPRRVTLFGQSAGAAHVSVLMASGQAQGLFQRAIVHSSGRFDGGLMGAPMRSLAEAEAIGVATLAPLGAHSLAQLRALPADQLLGGARGIWGPIVDGQLLARPVDEVFSAGQQMPISLLAGYTLDESAAYPMPALQTSAGFAAFARDTFGEYADSFLALYPHRDDAQALASSYRVRRDMGFAYQAYRFAQLHVGTVQAPVYLFNFMHAPPLPDAAYHEPAPPGGFGSYHGAELWYAFNNLAALPWPWTDADQLLADAMSSYWVSFATNGDPATTGLPAWPRFDAAGANTLRLGGSAAVAVAGRPFNETALDFFCGFYRRLEPA